MTLEAPQDGHVQVATDGAGKKIDNAELVRDADPGGTGETVYRQRIVIASDENPRQQANVSGEAGRGVLHVDADDLGEIRGVLIEIRDILRFVVGT